MTVSVAAVVVFMDLTVLVAVLALVPPSQPVGRVLR